MSGEFDFNRVNRLVAHLDDREARRGGEVVARADRVARAVERGAGGGHGVTQISLSLLQLDREGSQRHVVVS